MDKPFFPIRVPFCEKNEKIARQFLQKLNEFTGKNYIFTIVWITRKIKTLFKIKDEIKHKANVVYRGTSQTNPEDSYIGETTLIAQLRWKQHEDANHDTAPSKYLRENVNDEFNWEILSMSPSNWLNRKIHEAFFIQKHKPTLNRQVEHKKLILFRNGVT